MDREFLKSLELEGEVIESIMAKHGASVKELNDQLDTEKTTAETLQTQIGERNTDLKTLREQLKDNEDASAELETLQTKYDDETQKLQSELEQNRKMSEIRLGVTKAGAKNERAVLALLNTDDVKINDDGVHGLKEQIEALQESDAYLFEQAEETNAKSPRIVKGGNPKGGASGSNPFTKENWNLTEQGKIYKENPDLYNQLKAQAGK